ncbi:MAG: hypothetical protein AAFZ11_12555 [Pseudomonadota bacterium]
MRAVVPPKWLSILKLGPFAFLRQLARDTGAIAMIEFAYTLPVFVGFGLVGIECTNLVLAHQKAERIASTLADQVAGNMIPPNEAQIGDMFEAANQIAAPFEFDGEGNAIITAVLGAYDVAEDEVQNKIAWQRCSAQGRITSGIGREWAGSDNIAEGPQVDLPNDIELDQNEMVIVTEVYFPYRPIVSQALVDGFVGEDSVLKEVSVFRTRGDVLFSVTPVLEVPTHSC